MQLHPAVGAWLCTVTGLGSTKGIQREEETSQAETSTMTFKEQLWLNEAGEQIPAPSSKQRQESQQGTDRFIMFLGAAPFYFAGDKVTPPAARAERQAGMVIQSDGNKKLQPNPRALLPARGSTGRCG